jgi:hypothetical protein
MTTLEKAEEIQLEIVSTSDSDNGYSSEEDVVGFETDLNHLPKGNSS